MPSPLKKIHKFYSWWTSNLLSCLPEKWPAYFSAGKAKYDLAIVHQGDSIIVMTGKGEFLDSISLSGNSAIDLENLPEEDSIVGRFSNTQLKAAEKFLTDKDPSIYLHSETTEVPEALDIDLTDQTQNLDAESIDVVLGNENSGGATEDSTSILADQKHLDNVISLKKIGQYLLRDEDATVLVNDEEQATRVLESGKDEDTVIIKDDQGNLLQFESTGSEAKDRTVFFRSYGGRIKQVDPDDLDSQLSVNSGQVPDSPVPDLIDDGEPADYAAVVKLLKIHQGNKKCLYLLPDSKTFILNLSYPIETIQNIASVLRYDLEKHIPLSEQEVRYFYALNIDAISEKVHVEVAVIKAEEYDLLNLTLEPFLYKGLLCTTENFYRKYGNKINFLEHKSTRDWRSSISFSNLHLAFNWLLFIALLATPYLTFHQALDSIEAKSPAEIKRVKKLVSEFNSTNAESNIGSLLSEQINRTPKSIKLLSVLSANINNQAWLRQFSYKNNQINIKGEATSATAVSDDLNATGLFQSIKFVSSIVKNARTGKETFELLLTLKTDA